MIVDERTDANGKTKLMTSLVRFNNPETSEITTGLCRFLRLISMDLSDGGILRGAVLNQYITENTIYDDNILALSCDNSSVMISGEHSLKTLMLGKNPSTIDVPCFRHELASVMKNAHQKTIPNKIEQIIE